MELIRINSEIWITESSDRKRIIAIARERKGEKKKSSNRDWIREGLSESEQN